MNLRKYFLPGRCVWGMVFQREKMQVPSFGMLHNNLIKLLMYVQIRTIILHGKEMDWII